MAGRNIHGATVECVQGDIARQTDIDAVVNAANAALRSGGGVAGALHRAAGPGLATECRALAPISPGQAVITAAHDLPNRYVIHCLGPVFGVDEPADELLAACYRAALALAARNGVASLAFPSISTGAFGFPLEPAARIALRTVAAELPSQSGIRRVRFVLFSAADEKAYAHELAAL